MSFAQANAITRKWEGGISNHPADPGGLTKWGVIQKNYSAYRARRALPDQSVVKMTEKECADIYQSQFWTPIRLDEIDRMSPALAICVYDFGVNSGPQRAIRYLQAGLGLKVQDGRAGEDTLAAIKYALEKDERLLIRAYMDSRRSFLKSLRTFSTFGKGWMARCNGVEASALAVLRARKAATPIAAALMADVPDTPVMPFELGGDNDAAAPTVTDPAGNDPDEQAASQAKAVPEQPGTGKFDIGVATATASTAIGTGTQAVSAARDASSMGEMLISAGPWILLLVVGIGFGIFIWWHYRQKIKEAWL